MPTAEDKLTQLDRFLSILKELQHDRKKLIERLAQYQSEAEQAGFGELATTFSEVFASTSKNFEKFDTALHDMQLERNRVANEAK